MNEELERFKAVKEEKAGHKAAVMEALGRAKLADRNGEDSEADWQIVTERGVAGEEGKLHTQLVELADAYVEANPNVFSTYESMELEDVVKAVDVFRAAGMEPAVIQAEMWLLHRYEPQNIGGRARAVVRLRG